MTVAEMIKAPNPLAEQSEVVFLDRMSPPPLSLDNDQLIVDAGFESTLSPQLSVIILY